MGFLQRTVAADQPESGAMTPIHQGNGFVLGQTGGEQNHTLIASEMPQHTHPAIASANAANLGVATNNFWANGNQPAYDPNPNGQMIPAVVSSIGGGLSHNNMSPYLVLNFCIALVGIFPSRS
jgi:microcystin-dependent protein